MPQTISSRAFLLQTLLVSGLAFFPDEVSRNEKDYDGAQVLRVVETPQTKRIIKKNGLDVLSSNKHNADVLVPEKKVDSVTEDLSSNDIPYDVKIENLGEIIEEEKRATIRRRGLRSGQINFFSYQRLADIYSYMDYLARVYPNTTSVGVMGYTYEKRPLKYIKISSGLRNAKVVFIDGGIHAREWISPATVTYIMRELVENRGSLSQLLLTMDFYILPVLNPDGYEYTHTRDRLWRKNRSPGKHCNGTDLNRNFSFMFGGKGTSRNECSDVFRGKGPNSELESQSLTKFLLTLKGKLQAYISFHSYGQYILVPYGYDKNALAPDFSEMKRVAEEAAKAIRKKNGQQYTVGHTAKTMYPAAGGSDDWTKSHTGAKYTYCIELADSGDFGFLLPAPEIRPTAQGAFEAVKVIAAAAASVKTM